VISTIEGNDKHWRPLEEHDTNGYFTRQEHVTPHIGFTAHRFLRKDYVELPDPEYDFKREGELVVERLRNTSSSEYRQGSVRLFDSKLAVRGMIQIILGMQYRKEHTFENHMAFIYGISAAEHDGVLQAWREKVKHDLVRPTTVIQRWGNDVLNTYAGKPGTAGPGEIKARDFQPFIRTMPHAEYPSGSSCLCKAYQEFTDKFTTARYDSKLGPLIYPCPPNTHSLGCANGSAFVHFFNDMSHLSEICGESRL